jgi:site-specific DNA-methyltransferase (adenine-specific)
MKELEVNNIYQGDCLDGLKLIKSKSVKLIIADPPYFIGMTHNGKRGSFVDLAICKPFFKMLFVEFKRILNADGEVYFFCDWRSYAFYYPIFDAIVPGGARNLIVWDKISGAGNFYTFNHELMIYGSVKNDVAKKGANIWKSKSFASGAKMTNGEKVHDTQKTIEIIEKIITDSSKAGDLIVDPFSGSGTVSICCRKLSRDFIAFELDEDNFDVGNKRASQNFQSGLRL